MFLFITIFNVSMAYYRAPVVALMPDVVSSEHRSKANGVINLMGGVGAIYAFAIASQIYKIDDAGLANLFGVAPMHIGPILAFLTTSIIMVVATVILFLVVKEPEVPPVDPDKPEEVGIVDAIRQVSFATDKSAIALLFAILFWFFGWNAMETWYTKYGNEVLGFATADAAFQLTAFALSFVIFAIPGGLMAGKIGRKRTILAGLTIMLTGIGLLLLITDYYVMMIVLVIAGLGWSMVNVNSIVMVWQQLGQARVGAGTGLYYLFSMTAAIFGPLLTGIFFDATSISFLFPVSIVFLVIAFIFMLMVRTGEVGDEATSD
jgi:MFS family permease